MNANETQPATALASTTDEVIIFSLASILTVSLIIHAYYIGHVIWRGRQERGAAINRLMQDQSPAREDHMQGV